MYNKRLQYFPPNDEENNNLRTLSSFFFSLFKFLLKDNCFTEFAVSCQTWKWISHRHTYITLPFEPLFCLIHHPTPHDNTDPLFHFPEPNSKFPLDIYFTYGSIRFLVTLSIHLTLSSPLPMSINLFSMSVSPLLSCK